jgi:hypothetical protein
VVSSSHVEKSRMRAATDGYVNTLYQCNQRLAGWEGKVSQSGNIVRGRMYIFEIAVWQDEGRWMTDHHWSPTAKQTLSNSCKGGMGIDRRLQGTAQTKQWDMSFALEH